jgi:hypothetical protein
MKSKLLSNLRRKLRRWSRGETVAKVVSVTPLTADPMIRLVLDDGSLVYVPVDGPQYEAGDEFEPSGTVEETEA